MSYTIQGGSISDSVNLITEKKKLIQVHTRKFNIGLYKQEDHVDECVQRFKNINVVVEV